MKEYIERDPLIEALDSLIGLAIICKGTDAKPDPLEMLSALREDVKTCPTADVRENVRGEWVERETLGRIYHICSACGKPPRRHVDYETSYELSDFCPNCGAQMEAAI